MPFRRILKFDFSAVSKNVHAVQEDFNAYSGLCCDTFARKYAAELPDGLADRVLDASGVTMKLNEIFLGMRSTPRKLYVIIDEYDNFTNTILAESGQKAYDDLCHGSDKWCERPRDAPVHHWGVACDDGRRDEWIQHRDEHLARFRVR